MAKKPAHKELSNQHSRNESAAFESRSTDNVEISRQQQQTNDSRQRHLEDSKDYGYFKVVLFYCSLIVFLPVIAFFMLKSFMLNYFFTLSEVQENIYAAMGAVVALHIALGLYIYRAYFSTYPQEESTRKKLR